MIRVLVVVVMLAFTWTGWLQHRAAQEVATWITTLRPHVLVRYEHLRAWPGQAIQLHHVTLGPVGSWREGLGLSVGYRVRAAQLNWGQADAATGERTVQLDGLTVPLEGLPEHLALPLQRSGFESLTGALHLVAQPPLNGLPWHWTLAWQGDMGLTARLGVRFEAGPAFPAFTLQGMTLVDATLRVDDAQGVLDRIQYSAALASRRPVKAWADATVQRLLHAAAAADWMPPPSLVTTLERGLRAPQSFVLKVAPPAPVRLDQVHLYASEDRWALLGVAFALSPPRIASESR